MIESPKVSLFNRKGKLYVQYYLNGKCIQKSLRKDYTKENVKLAKKYVIPEIERKILLSKIQDNKHKVREFKHYANIYLKQNNLEPTKWNENLLSKDFERYKEIFGLNSESFEEFEE